MGERLRGFAAGNSDASRRVKGVMESGKLLPAFVPSHMMTTFFLGEFTGFEHLIFDGVARRIEQSSVLDDALVFYDRTDYQVISLELSFNDAHERLRLRGRSDEADEVKIKSRFAWYESEVLPALHELEKRGRKVHRIDARPAIEVIHKNVLTALGCEIT